MNHKPNCQMSSRNWSGTVPPECTCDKPIPQGTTTYKEPNRTYNPHETTTLIQQPPLPPKVVNDLEDAGWKFTQQPNDWSDEFDKEFPNDLVNLPTQQNKSGSIKSFITSLLSTQKEELVEKIEKMKKSKTVLVNKSKNIWSESNVYDQGFNDAINDIISLIRK